MKPYFKVALAQVILIIILSCIPSLIMAQGDPGGDPDVVPVDGGLVFLAAAGVAYSVKKLKEHRKKQNNNM